MNRSIALTLFLALLLGAGPSWAQKGGRPATHPTSRTETQSNGYKGQETKQVESHPDGLFGVQSQNTQAVTATEVRARLLDASTELRSSDPQHNERSAVTGLSCCEYERPRDTKHAELYKAAKQLLNGEYFSRAFVPERYRFVLTTDDTEVLAAANAGSREVFVQAAQLQGWSSLEGIRREFGDIKRQIGELESATVVLIGHQEAGRMVVRRTGGDQYFEIKALRELAAEARIELLIWGCESASFAVGGMSQSFREHPLVESLTRTLNTRPATVGEFLDGAMKWNSDGTKLVFNAVELLLVEQSAAVVIDRNNRSVGSIDIPRVGLQGAMSQLASSLGMPMQASQPNSASQTFGLVSEALKGTAKLLPISLLIGVVIWLAGTLNAMMGATWVATKKHSTSRSHRERKSTVIDFAAGFAFVLIFCVGGVTLLSLIGWTLYGLFGVFMHDGARMSGGLIVGLIALATLAAIRFLLKSINTFT